MKLDTILVIVISVVIVYAAFKYEREDLGCESCFNTSVEACSDHNSVYVKDTEYTKGDTALSVKNKLKKLVSFDDAAGSWKRCVLWGFLLTVLAYAIYAKGGSIDGTNIQKDWLFVISWIVFTTVLYAMKSFESAHIYRIIKENGIKLSEEMYKFTK
jgi:hypothetical protein